MGGFYVNKDDESKKENNSLEDIIKMIDTHRNNAYRKVNEELVTLYYEVGRYLSIKVKNEKWGSKIIENIAKGIKEKYPTLKGFDRIGLYRMVKFYETYKDNEIVSTLLTQIGWANNLIIITGTKSIEEREKRLVLVGKTEEGVSFESELYWQ